MSLGPAQGYHGFSEHFQSILSNVMLGELTDDIYRGHIAHSEDMWHRHPDPSMQNKLI